MKFLTGFRKKLIFLKISIHIAFKYLFKIPIYRYPRFIYQCYLLLNNFRHNKVVKILNTYKLQLYLPAYPSKAFFYALQSKLLRKIPGPVSTVFSMTKACSYKCPHCYQRNDKGRDLDENKLEETLLKIRDKGVAFFNIEGGEPFIRFDRLLKLIKKLDDRSEIWINTTGAHSTKDKLLELKRNNVFGFMVSIHSADSTTHDNFTRIKGAFDVACDFIKICKDIGFAIAINSVLSEEELKQGKLKDLMNLAKGLNTDYVQLIHPKPSGGWLHKKEEMQKEEKFITKVEKEHIKYNSSKMSEYPSLSAQVFEERKEGLGCTAGAIDRFYINANGEVQPCEFLNISFGNVNDEEFEVIYDRMRSYFKTPRLDWLCCTQAEDIAKIMKKYNLFRTPLPWKYTKELVDNWDRGEETKIYKKIGIYNK
ncbi:MAG: radical SAM protein [Bacteroidetes bacterium]|nr:radical SAM protein [Bacteroidota bacterium]